MFKKLVSVCLRNYIEKMEVNILILLERELRDLKRLQFS